MCSRSISALRTVCQLSQVIRRITSVIARPMIGSASGAPSATTMALATTPSETKPSVRACLPSATSAGLASRRPARSRTCAASSLPTKPIAPAAASAQRWLRLLRVDEAQHRLVERDAGRDEDRQHDGEAREPLAADAAQEEGDAERDGGQRVAEVVDQIGEQRDASRRARRRDLRAGSETEDHEAERDRPDACARAQDRAIDEPVRVLVRFFAVVLGSVGQRPRGAVPEDGGEVLVPVFVSAQHGSVGRS